MNPIECAPASHRRVYEWSVVCLALGFFGVPVMGALAFFIHSLLSSSDSFFRAFLGIAVTIPVMVTVWIAFYSRRMIRRFPDQLRGTLFVDLGVIAVVMYLVVIFCV